MAKRKRSKKFVNEECVYCSAAADTSDHVPPQGIFGEPKKEALLEVPCCTSCNSGFSKDDEYFRTVLTMIDGVEQNADAAQVLETVGRSFDKPKKKGFTRSFIKTLEILPQTTHSGLFIGMAPSFIFDKTRILATAERIVKALHWIEKGTRIPEGFDVTAYWWLDFKDNVKPPSQQLRNLAGYVNDKSSKVVGNEVFRYWASFLADEFPIADAGQSVWLLRFYGMIDILCIVDKER